MPQEPLPDWFHPGPPGGWVADDLDRLPSSPRLELIDGSLVVMSPQTEFHSLVTRRLTNAVEAAAPDHLWAEMRMTITLGRRQRPEPDVLVVDAPIRDDRTSYLPEEVVLVVEIVSPESEVRDRETKPGKYARAGIRHFWRVEDDAGTTVHAYELDDTTGVYVATGIHRDKLKVSVPFPMEIDLTTLFGR